MGAWGTAISSNDTYADIYSDFFEQYNNGVDVKKITKNLIRANKSVLDDPDDANNFWFALAKAQWECKYRDQNVFFKVQSIINSGADLVVWENLGAEEKDLKKRKVVLDKFLQDISSERAKAKSPKKEIVKEPAFLKGDCLIFKLANGNYGAALVLEAIYNTKYGYNLVVTTDINQDIKPTVQDITNSNVLIKNFGVWQNQAAISWIIPQKFKSIEHLFEKTGSINIEIIYDINQSGYTFSGNFDLAIIDQANRQFEHESLGNKIQVVYPVKELIVSAKKKQMEVFVIIFHNTKIIKKDKKTDSSNQFRQVSPSMPVI